MDNNKISDPEESMAKFEEPVKRLSAIPAAAGMAQTLAASGVIILKSLLNTMPVQTILMAASLDAAKEGKTLMDVADPIIDSVKGATWATNSVIVASLLVALKGILATAPDETCDDPECAACVAQKAAQA